MKRIDLLDAWRSLAVVLMLFYHFLYDLMLFGFMTSRQFYSPVLDGLQLFICCSFIILSGVSSRFSANNIKRGLMVLCAGVLVMIGGYAAGQPILFGILQFLGISMITYGFAGKYIQRINKFAAPILFLALFAVTYFWTENTVVQSKWLWPLGFMYDGFFSADYFPMMPWFFLFLFGTWLGGIIRTLENAPRLNVGLDSRLTWLGKHSLVIYVLHQPVLYGITWGIYKLL